MGRKAAPEGVDPDAGTSAGTGTVNMLVLAMLSQIAEDKQNVIFAMEEAETAIVVTTKPARGKCTQTSPTA